MTTLPTAEFAKRRAHLLQQLGTKSIAIIAAAPERMRNNDVDYFYRQDSDFYYLTGFPEPEAIAVLIPGRPQGEYILFNRVRDALQETWNGRRAGQVGAVEHYGADEAYPIAEFSQHLPELILGRDIVAYSIGRHPEFDHELVTMINKLHGKVRMGVVVPREFMNLEQWLHEMRQIKDPTEIQNMRQAAKISANAHQRIMQVCRPGMYEYQLNAELLHEFYYNGAVTAYNSIVAGGENACILHYVENNQVLKDGDLVLVDAGSEYNYYASDVTRTFPVNGRFSSEQRLVYQIVLDAQMAALAQAKPGNTLEDVHMAALRVLVAGLVQLDILQGSVDDLIQQKAYLPYYMHRTCHWLGLDTHDAGGYKTDGDWNKLEAGMVHTIEPGLYLSADIPGLDKRWWNIGVRIEDDVAITSTGCEVLSAGAPKTIAEIEAIMAVQ